ncbi:GGDEF domain-containing protein [uncultured Ruminococcus sp.]|uniref:GGDEF domain-containing protein n=1 Tax=uncultured Ruminococcus sp. TaxID=165186 RepID=UPI0026DB5A94|nr:GGDEF domain-containing protein [uncultured Ruminococcus sp.]
MMNDTAKRRRIKIGLLVSHLEDDFDDAVAEGAMIGAEQCDADLVIFPGRYIDGIYADKLRTVYEYQYNTLFDMAAANKFDVLLVLIGTLGTYLDNEHKAQFLKKFAGTPVITITAHIDGYPCIMLDNRTGMKEAIEHLIKVHGCKKIGMVSGPKTSDDALERLDVYKETLEENGIVYDEKRVAYGNFSKFCVDEVGKLIDDNPELEAIVFANDQMAIAGYKAMEERGIRPGKDILVTGFDDDPVAEELNPHLTTVKADPSELGYHAVQEAVNYVINKAINNDKISSEMVRRNSCGCQGNSKLKTISFGRISDDPEAFARRMGQFLFNKYSASETTAKMRENYVKIIYALDDYAREGNLDNEVKKDKVLEMTSTLASEEFFRFVSVDELYASVEYIQQKLISRFDNVEKHLKLNQTFIQIYKILAERNANYCKEKLEDNEFLAWQANSITRDMLVFEAYDDRAYETVVDKLTRLHMESSFLFSFEPALIHFGTDKWQPPEYMYLKAYHNGSDAIQLPHEEQAVTQKQLKKSLIEIKENNELLRDLSRQDALTGCYNRRGFFEELRKRLSNDKNEGEKAIMVFADLDCLKTINDKFGHEEGDFAILSAAKILKHSFGNSEIVGRIGGDEFVVCAFLDNAIDIPSMRNHIEAVTREYNIKYAADKPYIIHTSVGVYPFVCSATLEIGELLSHADILLYEEKKHKRSILKSDYE